MSLPTPVQLSGPKVSVDLQHLSVTSDAAGSYVETYSTYATVPALLTTAGGATKWLDDKMTEVATHVAYIAYRSDLLTTDRLVCNGRYYAIGVAADPFNQRKTLKLNLRLSPT